MARLDRNARRRRRAAEDFSEFRLVIATPTELDDLGADSTISMPLWPGRGKIGASFDEDVVAGNFTIAGRAVPALSADQVWEGPYLEEGTPVDIALTDAPAATAITIYVLDEWDRPHIIATGSIV